MIEQGLQVVGVAFLLVVLIFLRTTLRRNSPNTEQYKIHVWDGNRWIKADYEMIHENIHDAWVEARRMVPDRTPIMVKRKEKS